jgi:peptidoglycan hydrolase CwlO-like protein
MRNFRFLKLFLFFLIFSVLPIPKLFVFSDTASDEKTALEAELQQLEEQITQYDKDITKTEQEKKTLQNAIYLLKTKINKLNLQIQEGNVMIKDLGVQISDTENSIEQTSVKIEESKEKLSGILQTLYEEDQKSSAEILLGSETLSDFFGNLVALEALNSENQELLKEIKGLKTELEDQKNSLDDEKTTLENTVKVQTLQKQQSEANKKTQEKYLNLTEAEYQQTLAQKKVAEERASEIRARIFELSGVSNAPTFGEAYNIATYVSGVTGIRAAFLLAMLTQESNLGKNVGQCYLQDTKTGSGIYISTGAAAPKTMNPTQIPTFLEITKNLGMDPFKTQVSCVMYSNGKPYGWGGAMGPSQFIPTTWALYAPKIEAITGKTANPWNITDAFLATGLYLKELGGVTNEFKAAMQYFSGSSWSKWEEFYGKSVLSIAEGYEDDIAQLEASSQ